MGQLTTIFQPIKREEKGRLTHLLLQQRGEVLPETLLEVVAPRLSLLLLWTHRQRTRRTECLEDFLEDF